MSVITKRLHKLTKLEFFRHVLILISGSAISQLVVFLLTPLLTRIYSPEDFGLLSVYVAIMYTFSMMTSLYYQVAIPLPTKEKEAINILFLAIFCLVICVMISIIFISIFYHYIVSLFPNTAVLSFLIYLPISLFGFGLFQIFEFWLLRKESYGRITKGKVRMNLSQIFSQLGIGIFSSSPHGLIFGEVTGRLIGGGSMALYEIRSIWEYKKEITRKSMWDMAKRYRRFPLFASWSSILNGVTQHTPTLFIAYILGVKAAGWYIIAERVLSLPDSLIGYAVKQVYIAKSAKTLHTSFPYFYQSFKKILYTLIFLGISIYVPIILLAPIIFPIVFGPNWHEAGVFVQCIGLLFMSRFLINPISATFTLLEEQHTELVANFLKCIFLLMGMGVAAYTFTDQWHILWCISLFGTVGQLIMFIFITFIMMKKKKQHQMRGGENS